MTLQPFEVALLLFLAAWAAVDTTAFGQFMIGQPIPIGFLAGACVGEPAAGFVLGACLQLLWSRLAPVGAAAYPDVGPATVGGVALLAAWLRARGTAWPEGSEAFLPVRGEPVVALLVGLGGALLAGWLGQRLVAAMRRGNAALGHVADRAAVQGDFGGVERANLAGLGRAAGIGVIVVLPLLGLAFVLGPALPTTPSAAANPGGALFLWSALAAAATTFWPVGRRDLTWLIAGLALGALLVGVG